MTIFGIDVSEHQSGMSLRKAKQEGIEFVMLRLCDGTYRDKVFRSHLADAESAGLLVSCYWYVRAESEGTTLEQQADVIDAQLQGRKDLPIWLDVESVDAHQRALLTGADVHRAKKVLERRGYRVAGVYSGAWYWERMPGGEPKMTGLGALWVSNYGRNERKPYRHAYPGDDARAWSYPLGDKHPDVLQYGSQGIVAGFDVDVNAYRGTREQLQELMKGKTTVAPPTAPAQRTPVEKVLEYSRAHIRQDTYYWCGPATGQTLILAATGKLVPEGELARKMGTTTNGTDDVLLVAKALNEYLPGHGYERVTITNDPPRQDQIDRLWEHLTASVDAGAGLAVNIWAPPSNYPRASYTSTINPRYGGGFVMHYVAYMGYAVDREGRRHVWMADSGFSPFGSWITLEQAASLIPPRGYAWPAKLVATKPKPPSTNQKQEKQKEDTFMGDLITSLVNGTKKFKPGFLMAIIDRCTWENRVLLYALCRELDLDPKTIITEAIERDRKGADPLA